MHLPRIGSTSLHFARRRLAIFATVAGLALPTVLLAKDTAPAKDDKPAVAAKPNFDHVGPQVGDQLPDLKLRTLKGEPQRLADAWHAGPALIVTSSFTCPKSRSRWPELKAIVEKYEDKLNVVIVYVIEAHPVGSVCPYKGVEDITPENQRDGILRHQPATLDDRLELAKDFKRYLHVSTPIYVDTIKNEAWRAFGAAPNIAFLVDENGIVKARQGWFEGEAMQSAVEGYLTKLKTDNAKNAKSDTITKTIKPQFQVLDEIGVKSEEFERAMQSSQTDNLSRIVDKLPDRANSVFAQLHAHHETLLIEAIEKRYLAATELLLKKGADVNSPFSVYDSALQRASQIGQVEMVKLLLRHGADANFPGSGKSPVHEALIASHPEAAQALIQAGAHRDFYCDVGLGEREKVQAALTADPSKALRPDGAGRMPLDYAAANGQLEIAKILIAAGAPLVGDELTACEVAIHYAVRQKDGKMLELLLDAGASPNTAVGRRGLDAESTPPLHMAIQRDDTGTIKVLLAHNANPDVRDTYSMTALHLAARDGKAAIAELLIHARADVSARQDRFFLPCGSGEESTPSLNTPLHFAAACGNPETIKVLVGAGAKVEAHNRYGNTPLMSAVDPPLYTGIKKELQLKNLDALLSAGADINARNDSGWTILDIARAANESDSYRSSHELIDYLVRHGAKPGAPKRVE